MAKRDYYETLGISKGSSDADIKKAFRSKARELHPDKNSGSAKAEEEFKAVNEAYDILKDPNKKAAYDQYGHAAFENGGFGNTGGGGADFSSAFSTLGGEALIFHQHFQMYLKTFLETLWAVLLVEDLAPPQEEGQI